MQVGSVGRASERVRVPLTLKFGGKGGVFRRRYPPAVSDSSASSIASMSRAVIFSRG